MCRAEVHPAQPLASYWYSGGFNASSIVLSDGGLTASGTRVSVNKAVTSDNPVDFEAGPDVLPPMQPVPSYCAVVSHLPSHCVSSSRKLTRVCATGTRRELEERAEAPRGQRPRRPVQRLPDEHLAERVLQRDDSDSERGARLLPGCAPDCDCVRSAKAHPGLELT
jgi:hypothetical protein